MINSQGYLRAGIYADGVERSFGGGPRSGGSQQTSKNFDLIAIDELALDYRQDAHGSGTRQEVRGSR
jgi:hypothetical protein